jgi:hypothetical protein
MAPQPHLPKDSPMGKDIQSIVREMLLEELSFEHWDTNDGRVIIQLKLGDRKIGKALRLGIAWKQDHGHGGGTYVNGITLEEV